ncbi:MAG: sulfite oxidase-like oxidoreductase [Alphaproteobacteria bacterium]|nr:sulfite oxidase-like oxidoreductase [Alphaproteobacteria bacterium]
MADDEAGGSSGKIREKLIRAKQDWAREHRLITGRPDMGRVNRLPPGQRQVSNWPVLDLGIQPDLRPEKWNLRIDGSVEKPLPLSLPEFLALPQTEIVSDIHCVTAWSRYDNRWRGVASSVLLAVAKPRAEARHLVFHAFDGYTTNLALSAFSDGNVLLAHSWNETPLSREHGGPVRAVVPDWYFWKSAKWISRIEFLDSDRPGFWEVRGYHNQGDPWKEERYS